MYSRIRHLLYCQDELAQLQNHLLKQDDKDASTVDGGRLLRSRKRYERRNNKFPENALINKIGPKLKEYGKRAGFSLLTLAHTALRRPGGKDDKSCIAESSRRARP